MIKLGTEPKWLYACPDRLQTANRASQIVNNAFDKAEPPPAFIVPPTLPLEVTNWLALHAFEFQPMRVLHRGAFIWFWRITRHNDPKRPKPAIDLTLVQANNIRSIEIRIGRMWPEHIT